MLFECHYLLYYLYSEVFETFIKGLFESTTILLFGCYFSKLCKKEYPIPFLQNLEMLSDNLMLTLAAAWWGNPYLAVYLSGIFKDYKVFLHFPSMHTYIGAGGGGGGQSQQRKEKKKQITKLEWVGVKREKF